MLVFFFSFFFLMVFAKFSNSGFLVGLDFASWYYILHEMY